MKTLAIAAFACALALTGGAQAAVVVVDALANSTSGGTGAITGVTLTLGQTFTVSVNSGDLWNAGELPRWSNADGLTGPLFATGSDDSGYGSGTQIGANYGTYSQGGLIAPYGALVGQIGGGDYHLIGTNFSGLAWAAGALTLSYFDSNNGDNTQFVTATIRAESTGAVPEPATWALMISGFGLAGAALRRRRAVATA